MTSEDGKDGSESGAHQSLLNAIGSCAFRTLEAQDPAGVGKALQSEKACQESMGVRSPEKRAGDTGMWKKVWGCFCLQMVP